MRIRSGVSVAVSAAAVCTWSVSATADTVFDPNFPVTALHAAHGANSAGSFSAAAMMGAQGWSNEPRPAGDWEGAIVSLCHDMTAMWVGSTLWPSGCNPRGMAIALNQLSTRPSWVDVALPGSPTDADDSPNKVAAMNGLASAFINHRSPVVIPIYGQADHFVTITQVTGLQVGSVWQITHAKLRDGGPYDPDEDYTDSSGNSYFSGLYSCTGDVLNHTYYRVLTAINPSCDAPAHSGCTSDPYYSKYLYLYEPPPGSNDVPVAARFARAPGVVSVMNEHVAQTSVWRALTLAGTDSDPEIWGAIHNGVAAPAFHVNGVFPSGAPWDYYLVPILANSNSNLAIAFVQLAGDDGSFQGVQVVDKPTPFNPVSRPVAEDLARATLLANENLTGGALMWDPRSDKQIAKSPIAPYYEFHIVDAKNPKKSGVIRVALQTGNIARD